MEILTSTLIFIFTVLLHSVCGDDEIHVLFLINFHDERTVVLATIHHTYPYGGIDGKGDEVDVCFPSGEKKTVSKQQFIDYVKDIPKKKKGVTEAPSAELFLNVMDEFEDQLVKYQESPQIIRDAGFADLSANQIVIYERIKSRRPENPKLYRIPKVEYRPHDRVMRKGKQVGMIHWGDDGRLHAMDNKTVLDGMPDLLKLENDDVLETLVRTHTYYHTRIKPNEYIHVATFWRDMWLVKELLPEGPQEIALTKKLDDQWLKNQRQDGR